MIAECVLVLEWIRLQVSPVLCAGELGRKIVPGVKAQAELCAIGARDMELREMRVKDAGVKVS